jgi:CheY-like chemotaxis protein
MKVKLNNKDLSNEQAATLHEYLDLATTIIYCANHQKRIVDDVLTLSKLDARLLQIYPESTNPIKLYREILGLFGPEIRASGMNTNYTIGEGYNRLELKRVMMDPNRVTQIVINLLSNAIKFTKKGKKRGLEMTLNAHTEEPANKPMGTRYVPSGVQHHDPTDQPWWGLGETIYLSFSVKDSGLGMTPQEASNLFQKFAQASPRTHTQFGGSGLGLYISRNLAELHGGRIGLSSHAGFGSTFEFYVKVRRCEAPKALTDPVDRPLATVDLEHRIIASPVMQQAKPVQIASQILTQAQAQLTQAPLSSRTAVLIVEDNLINQRLLRKLLTKHGYDTMVANNGEEALVLLASSTWNPIYTRNISDIVLKIDIVLCDIEMPIMDGKTCVRRVRQLQQESLMSDNIPMIAITGNARLEQVEEMRQCGFDDVVTKPYKIDQLLNVIGHFVGTHGNSSPVAVS